MIGLTTLSIVLLTYFGRVRFKGIPGGIVAVSLGTLLAWTTGLAPVGARPAAAALQLPVPVFGIAAALTGGHLLRTSRSSSRWACSTCSGRCRTSESAEAAGDGYDTRYSLTVNGLGSLAAAAFGSAFPTTIYIGHPGWKALGARAGYSVLNGRS